MPFIKPISGGGSSGGGSGTPGATGPAGPAGATGATGAAGVDGKTILSGTSDPTAGTGTNGDYYINTSSVKIFGPKSSGSLI